jgi:hypothetical protein
MEVTMTLLDVDQYLKLPGPCIATENSERIVVVLPIEKRWLARPEVRLFFAALVEAGLDG